jgi:hypothetical protein
VRTKNNNLSQIHSICKRLKSHIFHKFCRARKSKDSDKTILKYLIIYKCNSIMTSFRHTNYGHYKKTWWWWWWWHTFVRNVIIEINNVIMKIKWRGRGNHVEILIVQRVKKNQTNKYTQNKQPWFNPAILFSLSASYNLIIFY